MEIEKEVNPRFEDFLFDWYYNTYLLIGAYGSSKSYHVALKIILKCFLEKRKVLVVREVYDTHRESTFSLFTEILEEMDLLAEGSRGRNQRKVVAKESPFLLTFPNGSRIIFRGMDKPNKLKSINNITIVWLEEASEIKYSGFKELRGRLRHPTLSIHFILSSNPVGVETWVYSHFFKRVDEEGKEHTVLDDERLYQKRTIVKNGVYYHHSIPEDNVFLSKAYIKTLDEMQEYDPDLYRVARLGKFGINGTRVLYQFEVAKSHEAVMDAICLIPLNFRFTGMDFGFVDSYNAVVECAVDDTEKILYISWEYYKNKMTDVTTAKALKAVPGLIEKMIIADNSDPEAIQFYRDEGFKMRGCKKWAGSRLFNTRKMKRFKKIICSPNCLNCIRELSRLTYKKDAKDRIIYDEFNIDPHTFSALWYALDTYRVADVKEIARNSVRGG